MGQALGTVLGVAGAVVGGYFGGPMGAQAGFMAGSLLGSLLTPKKTPTPADIRIQDSAYGKYIPRVWGRYRVSGNIIWAGQPSQHTHSGKGMGGSKGQTYVTMSFAVALCKGPIQSVMRIWANGQLVYDVSNPSDFEALTGSSSMISGFTVYLGTETQNADPTMQAYLGAANVPAYRGTAYVVFNDLSLEQWGDYMPSLSFEVIANGTRTYVSTPMQTMVANPGLMYQSPYAPSAAPVQLTSTGVVYGVQWKTSNLNSHIWVAPYQATAAGVTWYGPAFDIVDSFPSYNGHTDDEPGMLYTDGFYRPFSGVPLYTGIVYGPFGSVNCTWVKRAGAVYASSIAFNQPFLICKTPLPAIGAQLVTTISSNRSGYFKIACVTDNYVYVFGVLSTDLGNFYQFDHDGHFVATLFNDTSIGSTSQAKALSDSEIYIAPNGGTVKMWNGTSLVDTGVPSGGGNVPYAFNPASPDLMYFSGNSVSQALWASVLSNAGANPTVASIASDVLTDVGLQASQFDVSSLTDTLIGFARTANSSPRDTLSPLMSTYFFDVVDSEAKLKFVRRGGATAVSIPLDDLGQEDSSGQAGQNPIKSSIQQEAELPRTLALEYVSASTDYQTAVTRAFRAQTASTLDQSASTPVVIPDNEASTRAYSMLWETWGERQKFTFSMGLKYLLLEPADVVNVPNLAGGTYQLRLTKVSNAGKGALEFEALPNIPSLYPNPSTSTTDLPQAPQGQGFSPGSLPYSGQTVLRVLDVSPLRNQDTSQALYIAACGMTAKWPGAAIDVSRDDVNFSSATMVLTPSVIGTTTTLLGGFSGGNIVDELNSVTVQLYNSDAELSSVTNAAMLSGANACYIGGELMFFRTATQVSAGVYTLNGLLRGRQGTGYLVSSHVVGEDFVLLDPNALGSVALNLTDIGSPVYFEPYLNNIFGNSPGGQIQVTPTNGRVRPLAPHQFSAIPGSAAATNDITLRWIRAARVNNAWVNGADVPLDESAENYTITITNGSGTQVRAVTVAGPFISPALPTYVYSAANITADGFSNGSTIKFSVQQNSDQGVLGFAATTTTTR